MSVPAGRSAGRRRGVAKPLLAKRRQRPLFLETLERRQMLAAELEPNESTATATTVAAGDTLEGRLSRTTDVDFFVTSLNQGQRFAIDTFNINAPRFDPTLPPGLEILNSDGETMATSHDGRTISIVAPATGQYFVRITSENAFGTFVGDYGMQSSVGAAPTQAESEPNDNSLQADSVTLGVPFNGNLASSRDIDTFTVDVNAGDSVVIAFAGLAQNNPAAVVRTASGVRLGQDLDGNGLAIEVPVTGPIFVTLTPANSAGAVTGDYSAVISRFADTSVAPETGSDFVDAETFRGLELQETMTGVLSDVGDADLYRVEIDGIKFLRFDVQASGQEQIVETGKELRLYDQYGHLVEYASGGRLDTERVDALVPGTYYVEVVASSPVGTGAYALSYFTRTNFSLQRDNALHYFDFGSMDPYLGFARVNPYAVPEAQDYYLGVFDSRFEVYDVDTTLTRPVDGNDRVASGIGDFGNIGAGGFGGGSRGTRSSQGNTVNSALEQSANSLRYLTTGVVMHEFGHATGLPHARDVQALMSYVGSAEYLPVGSGYAFRGTDSRRPQDSVYDVRDYLDWALQPGAQVYISERDESRGPTSLDPFLQEMSLDHKPVAVYGTGTRPFDVATGDFNADGRPDVVTANDGDNTLSVFLTGPSGSLGAPTSIAVGADLRQWTEAIEVGDFDRDGDDDLAVIPFGGRRVTVYLSNRDGTFATGVNYTLPREPQGLKAVDVNSDGRLDLVAVTVVTDTGYTLIGAGDGTFTPGVNFSTGSNPYSVTAGDFNGDGRIDLATANSNGDTVTILRGSGFGGFVVDQALSVGDNPQSVTALDFNRDRLSDLAVANRNDRTIDLYRGVVGGRMQYAGTLDLQFNPFFLDAQDVNGDGFTDLLASGLASAQQVALADGSGGFLRPVSLQAGNNEAFAAVADFDSDGVNELAVVNNGDDTVAILDGGSNNPKNDRVVVYGSIDADDDVDRYQLNVAAGERWTIDVDAAEFQYPLDSILRVLDDTGAVLVQSDDAIDRNTGIDSVDSFIDHVFTSAAAVTIEVAGKLGSAGDYRLKVTPGRALDDEGPKVNAVFPENESTINGTSELIFYFNDVLDPETLIGRNITVVGDNTGSHLGTASFNPLDSTLIWNANQQLPPDSYTVTLSGLAGGIADLAGNLLDGEIASDFRFPEQSGDDTAGGSFVSRFTVNIGDATPATVRNISYLRDPYNRGRFQIQFFDHLSVTSVHSTDFTLRGTGADGVFNTPDDTLLPLDATYEAVNQTFNRTLNLYSRGIPDSGRYLVQGTLRDAAGQPVQLSEPISVSGSVPESALFTDAGLTSPGLAGSYVNSSLRGYAIEDDWRVSQTISGARVDPQVAFSRGEFGDRASVGVTGGADNFDWDDFSVQWDGFVEIPEDGVQLLTRSEDGSRMWIDLNGDGNLLASDGELFDNGWGTAQRLLPGELSPELDAGTYRIRIQYETTVGREQMHLEWLRPGSPVDVDGYIHGPSVIDVSVAPGSHLVTSSTNEISVQFSGNIDTSTLNTSTLQLRRSVTPEFFDGDDEILIDTDGVVDWDPVTLTATLRFAAPLGNGFYLLEADGDVGGITNPAGNRLDGEFLSSRISGNTSPFIWQNTPSGDGIAGGDYRASFSIAQPTLAIELETTSISERGGRTRATILRRFADVSAPLIVNLGVSDPSELSLSARSVTIPAGEESVTIDVSAVDDNLVDGTQEVAITASATGVLSTEALIDVTDYELLDLRLSSPSLSENGGTATLVITRLDARGDQIVNIDNSRPDKVSVPISAVIPDGELSVSVTLTGVDNNILDGTQLATLTTDSDGLIDATISFDVTDFEELTIDVVEDSISELGGTSLATLTRTDSRGSMLATINVSPAGQLSVPTVIQFLDGESTSAPFALTAVDNDFVDGDRTVFVSGAATGYVQSSDSLTITDHEQLMFVFDQTSISEAGGVALGRVVRTDTRGDVTATLASSLASRLGVPASIAIADGQAASRAFEATAVDNDTVDGSEFVTVTADLDGYITGVETIEITDFEALNLSVVEGPVSENDGHVTFLLTRPAAGPETNVVLRGSVPGFVVIPGQVTFPEGESEVTFVGILTDNEIVAGDRNFVVLAESDRYINTNLVVPVLDDDLPEIMIELERNQLVEGVADFDDSPSTTVRLSRNTRHETSALVNVSIPGVLDVPGVVRFPAGRSFIEFEIHAIDNLIADGTRDLLLTVESADHPTASASLTIFDDERPSMRWTTASVSVVESGDASLARLVLDVAPVSDVVIDLATNLSDQISVQPNSLTFSPSNWNLPQEVQVIAINDQTTEPLREMNLQASVNPSTPTTAFLSVDPAELTVFVEDDDVPGIVLAETDGSTIVTETGLDDTFSLSLQTRPLSDVQLVVDGSRVAETVFTPSVLTFSPENWDQPQTVTVSTPLDFNIDQNFIGSVFIAVDPDSSEPSYTRAGRRQVAVVHVDSVLSDLRIRRSGNQIVLVDEFSNQVLRSTPADGAPGSELTMGSRGERVFVESITDGSLLVVETLEGNDVVTLNEFSVGSIDGGAGFDTLAPLSVDQTLAPGSIGQVSLLNFERIDLSNAGSQSLHLTSSSVAAMTDQNNVLHVIASDADQVTLEGDWIAESPVLIDGTPTHRLTLDGSVIQLSNGSIWQNPMNPFDVDGSGNVTSLDALRVINRLSTQVSEELPNLPAAAGSTYFDANGDGIASAVDALQVINALVNQISAPESENSGTDRGQVNQWFPGAVDQAVLSISGSEEDDEVQREPTGLF